LTGTVLPEEVTSKGGMERPSGGQILRAADLRGIRGASLEAATPVAAKPRPRQFGKPCPPSHVQAPPGNTCVRSFLSSIRCVAGPFRRIGTTVVAVGARRLRNRLRRRRAADPIPLILPCAHIASVGKSTRPQWSCCARRRFSKVGIRSVQPVIWLARSAAVGASVAVEM